MDICTMRKKYICAYIGLFYCIRIYNVKLKAHEKLKKKEKRGRKLQRAKKIERRKEKELETSNGKSKKTIYY